MPTPAGPLKGGSRDTCRRDRCGTKVDAVSHCSWRDPIESAENSDGSDRCATEGPRPERREAGRRRCCVVVFGNLSSPRRRLPRRAPLAQASCNGFSFACFRRVFQGNQPFELFHRRPGCPGEAEALVRDAIRPLCAAAPSLLATYTQTDARIAVPRKDRRASDGIHALCVFLFLLFIPFFLFSLSLLAWCNRRLQWMRACRALLAVVAWIATIIALRGNRSGS